MKGLPIPPFPVGAVEAPRPASPRKRSGQFDRHLVVSKPSRESLAGHDIAEAKALSKDFSMRPVAGNDRTPLEVDAPLSATSLPIALGADAKIYPLGLSVMGYLSTLGAPDEKGASNAHDVAAGIGASTGNTERTLDRSLKSAITAGVASQADLALPLYAPSMPNPTDAAGEADGKPARVAKSIGATTPAPWSEQLLRLECGGTVATLRIRDFRLDPEQARRLIRDVLATARSAGHHIDRVVVNGQEWWRATDHAGMDEMEGDAHGY